MTSLTRSTLVATLFALLTASVTMPVAEASDNYQCASDQLSTLDACVRVDLFMRWSDCTDQGNGWHLCTIILTLDFYGCSSTGGQVRASATLYKNGLSQGWTGEQLRPIPIGASGCSPTYTHVQLFPTWFDQWEWDHPGDIAFRADAWAYAQGLLLLTSTPFAHDSDRLW